MFAWINFAVLLFASLFFLYYYERSATGHIGKGDRPRRLRSLRAGPDHRLDFRIDHRYQLRDLLFLSIAHSTA